MKAINTYLTFGGNCREAMTFYQKCLGAEVDIMPFSAGEGQCDFAEADKDKVMHARLTWGPAVLMASDTMPGMPLQEGNNFAISINCESRPETEKVFAALSESGKVTVPLGDVFWGAYFGMLTDRFGINWMLSFENPKQV